jgi:hypothetical protein
MYRNDDVYIRGNKCSKYFQFKILRYKDSDEYLIQSVANSRYIYDIKWTDGTYSVLLGYKQNTGKPERWRFYYKNNKDRQNKEFQIINVAYKQIFNINSPYKNDYTGISSSDANTDGQKTKFKIYRMDGGKSPSGKIGYVVKDVRDFFDEGIYCMAAVHSGKALGLYKSTSNSQIFQAGRNCSPEFTYRVLKVYSGVFKLENQSGKGYLSESLNGGIVRPVTLVQWKMNHFKNGE